MRACGIEAVDAAYEIMRESFDGPEADKMMDAVEALILRHDTACTLCIPSPRDYKDNQLAVIRRAVSRTIRKITDFM